MKSIEAKSKTIFSNLNLIQHYLLTLGKDPFSLNKFFSEYDGKFPIDTKPFYLEVIPELSSNLFITGQGNDPYGILKNVNKVGFPNFITIADQYKNSEGILVMYKVNKSLCFDKVFGYNQKIVIKEFVEHFGLLLEEIFGLTDISYCAYNYLGLLGSNGKFPVVEGTAKIFLSNSIRCQQVEHDFYLRNDEIMFYFDSLSCGNLVDFAMDGKDSYKKVEISAGDYIAFLFAKDKTKEPKAVTESMDLS